MSVGRVAFTRVVQSGTVGLAALSFLCLLAAQGGRFSDRLDIVTHFAPALLAAAGLSGLVAGLTPNGLLRRTTFAIASVAALLASLIMAPEFLRKAGPEEAVSEAAPQIKLIQLNSWSGRNQTLNQTVEWLVAEAPDIIVVEEATHRFRRAFEARADYHRTCDPDDRCEVIIYSKAAPISAGLPDVKAGSFFPATRATFDAPGGPFTVIGAHYTWPIPAGSQQQQSLRLVEMAKLYDRGRLIVAGDFNSTPWSFTLRRQDQALSLSRRNRAMLTWPAGAFSPWRVRLPLPVLAIDHVYAGRDWTTIAVRRGPAVGSDHFPVVVTLALSPAS